MRNAGRWAHNHAIMAAMVLGAACLATTASGEAYFPPPEPEWATRAPEEAGFDPDKLAEAVAFAQESVTPFGQQIRPLLQMFLLREPHGKILGPVKDRGEQNGILIRDGYIVAEWGDTRRVDMTFSVTKSFVSACAGLAWDDGIIKDVQDPVQDYVDDGGFDSEHNAKITWHMLLNQTSEWEGTLWDIPDWSDRYDGEEPTYHEPGTNWHYNDVRVNRLSHCVMLVMKRPLPEVLAERIMQPIGASDSWEWHGYENSWVTIDGRRMQSVSGGGHWGGGMWISTRDLARFGYLYLHHGAWGGRQLLSSEWVATSLEPTPQRPTYGYMNWAPNTDQKLYPSAPENNFFAHGAGTNVIWVNPEHNMVAVLRWLKDDAMNTFVEKVLAALKEEK